MAILFKGNDAMVQSSTISAAKSNSEPRSTAKPTTPSTPLSSAKDGKGLVTVGEGTRITGVIDECSTIDVCGILEGDVFADLVIIRSGGGIRGNIQATNAEIYGTIEGNVSVSEHLEIKSTGNVSGVLAYATFAVERGAHFHGVVQCEQTVPHAALAVGLDAETHSDPHAEDPNIVDTYVARPANGKAAVK